MAAFEKSIICCFILVAFVIGGSAYRPLNAAAPGNSPLLPPTNLGFAWWCEAYRDDASEYTVNILLSKAGAFYRMRNDCEGAAKRLATFKHIDLHRSHIVDLRPLAALSQLRSLDLSGNDIHDVSPLAQLAFLNTLDLQDNPLDSVESLAGLKNLRHLYLSSDSKNRDELAKTLPPQISEGDAFVMKNEWWAMLKNSVEDLLRTPYLPWSSLR